jgi:hypothetical protein
MLLLTVQKIHLLLTDNDTTRLMLHACYELWSRSMSKRRGIRRSSLRLSAVGNWCKKSYKRLLDSVGHWREPGEVARPTNIGHPLEVDFCGERTELRRLTKLLSIGERVRILCDDGVLVAEKVSDTQFKLIQSQTYGKLVH